MNRKFSLVAFALVCLLVLAACAAPAAPAEAPAAEAPAAEAPAAEAPAAGSAEGVDLSAIDTTGLNLEAEGTFSYWNGFTAADRPVMEQNIAVFDALYPNLTVNMDIQPWDTLLPKLLPSLRTGSDPDVVTLDPALIAQYVKADSLQPLDELWGEGGLDPTKFSQGVIDLGSVNGVSYGAPVIFFAPLLYVNNDLLEAAGLPAACPDQWSDFTAALKTLTIDEDGDGTPEQYGFAWGDHGAVSIWPMIVWANGGDFVNADATQSMLDDPKTIEAVQNFSDLIINDKILALGLSGVEADSLFQTQKAAMTISGPWVSTGFTDAGLNFQICQIPEGPAGRFTQGSGSYFVMNKNTVAPDAVKELMKFWQTDWAQKNWSANTGFAPTRVDLAEDPEILANPHVAAFAAALPFARTYLGGVVEYSKINDDIIMPAILEVARGNKTAEESLTEAAAAMNEVLAEQNAE